MNLFNLLTKEKHVAGIEIDDSAIRIAFLYKNPKKNHSDLSNEQKLITLEESLPPDVVVEGVVMDRVLLAKTIKSLWLRAELNTNYAIVAIPDDKIYSRIFSFPKTIDKSRLKEAMTIGVSFQLPMKIEEVYLHWEHISSSQPSNDVLMSAIPRNVANGYIDALNLAGIKPIALESNLASIARAVKIESNEATIFTKKTDDDATIFILKERAVLFSRSVPIRFISKIKLANEIKKIKTSFESERPKDSKPISVIDIDQANIRDEYADFQSLSEPKTKWLVALGAAIRGSISEGNDNMISLLPIKTEEMYAYQKASTFATLISNMIISVSLFFVIVFLSVYFLMLSFSKTTSNSIASYSAPLDSDIVSKEESINRFNIIASTTKEILSETPMWSNLLEEIQKNITPGITVLSLNISSLTSCVSISGTAKDRVTLNNFKKRLQDSQLFSSIILPINNLEKNEDVTFNISLQLKDPSNFYYK